MAVPFVWRALPKQCCFCDVVGDCYDGVVSLEVTIDPGEFVPSTCVDSGDLSGTYYLEPDSPVGYFTYSDLLYAGCPQCGFGAVVNFHFFAWFKCSENNRCSLGAYIRVGLWGAASEVWYYGREGGSFPDDYELTFGLPLAEELTLHKVGTEQNDSCEPYNGTTFPYDISQFQPTLTFAPQY